MGQKLVRGKMMEIIKMTATHVPQVALLEQLCFSAPWSENAVAGELTNPLSCWLVAAEGEKVCGYVGSQAVLGEADMMNIAVDPAYRRQGIARRLVEQLIAELKAAGNYQLTLEVRASNAPAIGLYETMGFAQVGCRPKYYTKPTEDALILRKEWEV